MTALTSQAPAAVAAARPVTGAVRPRVLLTELRKMFDTRSGMWLLASIAITSVLATGAVILWAPDDELTYSTFATAIGVPMTVILPIIAILSVTSEWSQRSGLSTFTLVPHRGAVIRAKLLVSVAIGATSMVVAMAIGALGNLAGTALLGVDRVWDASFVELADIVLANVLGLLVGFMLGVLVRSSAGAIVAYFVYSFVLPTLAAVLAGTQQWFRDLRPWVDVNYAQSALYNGTLSPTQWTHLAVTGVEWVLLPLVLGLWLVLRAEVK